MKSLLRGFAYTSLRWGTALSALLFLGSVPPLSLEGICVDALAPASIFQNPKDTKSSTVHPHIAIVENLMRAGSKPIAFTTPARPGQRFQLRVIKDYASKVTMETAGGHEAQMLFVEALPSQPGHKPYAVGMATHLAVNPDGVFTIGWFSLFPYQRMLHQLEMVRAESPVPLTYLEAMWYLIEGNEGQGDLVSHMAFLYHYLLLRMKDASDASFLGYWQTIPANVYGSGVDSAMVEFLFSYIPHGTTIVTTMEHERSLAALREGKRFERTPIFRFWKSFGLDVVGHLGDNVYQLRKNRNPIVRSSWDDPTVLGPHVRFAAKGFPSMDLADLLKKRERRITFSTHKDPDHAYQIALHKDATREGDYYVLYAETIASAQEERSRPVAVVKGIFVDEEGVLHLEEWDVLKELRGKGIEDGLGEFLTSFAPIHSRVRFTPFEGKTLVALAQGQRFAHTVMGRWWRRLGYEVIAEEEDSFLLSKTFPVSLKSTWEAPAQDLGNGAITSEIHAQEKYLTREGTSISPLTPTEARALDPRYNSVKEFWDQQDAWKIAHPRAKIIYAIRHGESASNVLGLTQEPTTYTPLTPLGQRHAKALTTLLQRVPFRRLFTSDTERAYMTLIELAKRKDLLDNFRVDKRLREFPFWPAGGMSVRDANKVFKDWLDEFYLRPDALEHPVHGSIREFVAQLRTLLKDLAAYEDPNIALGTHGGTIYYMVMEALGIPLEKFFSVRTMHPFSPNAGVTVMAYHPDKDQWELLVYGDNSYLEENLRPPTPVSWDIKARYYLAAVKRILLSKTPLTRDFLADFLPSRGTFFPPLPKDIKATLQNNTVMEASL